jgi:hypothetical protein
VLTTLFRNQSYSGRQMARASHFQIQ